MRATLKASSMALIFLLPIYFRPINENEQVKTGFPPDGDNTCTSTKAGEVTGITALPLPSGPPNLTCVMYRKACLLLKKSPHPLPDTQQSRGLDLH